MVVLIPLFRRSFLNLTVKKYENWSTSNKVLPFGATGSGNYDSPCSVIFVQHFTRVGRTDRRTQTEMVYKYRAVTVMTRDENFNTGQIFEERDLQLFKSVVSLFADVVWCTA